MQVTDVKQPNVDLAKQASGHGRSSGGVCIRHHDDGLAEVLDRLSRIQCYARDEKCDPINRANAIDVAKGWLARIYVETRDAGLPWIAPGFFIHDENGDIDLHWRVADRLACIAWTEEGAWYIICTKVDGKPWLYHEKANNPAQRLRMWKWLLKREEQRAWRQARWMKRWSGRN